MRHHSPRLPADVLYRMSGTRDAVVEPPQHQATTRAQGGLRYESHTVVAAPNRALADMLGVTRRSLIRWSHDGIPIDSAEDAAFKLGLHPACVWGDEWLFAAGCPLAYTVAGLYPVVSDEERDQDAARKRNKKWREIEGTWRRWSEQRERWDWDRETERCAT